MNEHESCDAAAAEWRALVTTLRARIRPRNWAGGQLLTDCLMEQDIRLEGACAIVKFRFRELEAIS